MKINKLLVLSLTAVALASCSKVDSIKKPKTSVNRLDFIEAFEEEYKNNPLFCQKKGSLAYSYVVENADETKTIEKTYLVNEELYDIVETTKTSGKAEYDNNKKVMHSAETTVRTHKSGQIEGEVESKYDYTVFTHKDNIYTTNNLTKVFTVEDVDDADSSIESSAKKTAGGMASIFLSIAKSENWKKDDFYIDGDVYTIVIERSEKDEISTTRYQFIIGDDEFSYRTDEKRFETLENGTYEVESKTSYTLKKKSVSLKTPNISEYLGVEEMEEEEY